VGLAFDSRRGSALQWAGAASAGNVTGATEALPRTVPARCVLFGDFELDVQEQRLSRAGQLVKIPGKIYHAMVVLIESPGDLVTREQIRNRLWPRDAHLNYDANVNTTVNKLRQVLGDTSEGSNFIQTIPRRGYCFVAPVRYADAPATPPKEAGNHAVPNPRGVSAIGGVLRSERARIWFTASVVTWVTAAVLFASMLLWHSHQVQASVNDPAKAVDKR
jgi:DNA-binding winged helix-turn-helix (wHTH) protein